MMILFTVLLLVLVWQSALLFADIYQQRKTRKMADKFIEDIIDKEAEEK